MKLLGKARCFLLLFLVINTRLFAQVGLEQVLTEKRHRPVCATYSFDSKYIASGSTNSDILVWSSTDYAIEKRLEGLTNFPISLAFSRDNNFLISGGKDHLVTIWDLNSGQKKKSLHGHTNNILSVDVSPDNKFIVSTGIDRSIRIWDFETGTLVRILKGHKGQINSVCYNYDGSKLLTASADRKIIEWNAETGEQLRVLSGIHTNWVRKALYSPDGKYIVSCSDDTFIVIWNNATGEAVNTIRAHRDDVFNFSFSPDGKYLVSGGHDKLLVVIEVETGLIAYQSPEQENYILAVAFSPNGKTFASSVLYSEDLKIWNVEELQISPTLIAKAEVKRTIVEKPKIKPKIHCIAPADSLSSSKQSVYPLHLSFISESDISKVDVLINGKLFSSYEPDDLRVEEDGEKHLERNLFLNEGENSVKIALQTENGLIATRYRSINYTMPKKPELTWNEGLSDQMETNKQVIALDNIIVSPSNLATITLYNNDKEIYSQKEVVVSSDSNLVHFKRAIALFEGTNRLKVVVVNEGGMSESEILTVNYAPEKAKVEVIIPPAKPNPYRFALIIGNEDYSSYQVGLESESDVEYAKNDAIEFRKYAIKYMGVPEDQAILKLNSRYIEMKRELKKINGIMELTNGKAEVFFYYAGHGFPHEKTKEPYLIPVDGSGTDLEFSAIKLKDIYTELSEYPSARVTVFLDACFSGGGRNKGILEARGVKVKPKETNVVNKMVVFSAASENQTSLPYEAKEHGIFTYYLLQKIEETGGIVTYKELSDYIIEQVGVKSYLINSKKQVPEINISPEINDIWQDWRLR